MPRVSSSAASPLPHASLRSSSFHAAASLPLRAVPLPGSGSDVRTRRSCLACFVRSSCSNDCACACRAPHSAPFALSSAGWRRPHSGPLLLTNRVACALSLLVVILCAAPRSPRCTLFAPPPARHPAMSHPHLPHARDADAADAAIAAADDAALLWSFLCQSGGETNGNASDATASCHHAEAIGDTCQPGHSAPPATRLYRHALESILSMLTLDDLSRAVAVSREWFAAVKSMKPIAASMFWDLRHPFLIAHILGSPLLRHLAAIDRRHSSQLRTPMDNASMTLLSQHVPNLTSLQCALKLAPQQPLVLPAQLQSLELELAGEYSDAVVDGVLTTVAALPSLARFHLQVLSSGQENSIQLRLLAACHSLTDFTCETFFRFSPMLSQSQAEQIRLNLGHLQRISFPGMGSDVLARLLQPPVTVRWRDIGQVSADARTGELLLTLQTLTKLDLCYTYKQDISDVGFLRQFPLLTSLNLTCRPYYGTWNIPANVLLASLVCCTQLTELNLTCGFKSAHWSALFAKLTRIKKLTIRGGDRYQMDSLGCFEAGHITQSLQELTLKDLALPPSEVSHLYGLCRLQSLHLDRCFSPLLDDAGIASLTPPTALLPALTELCLVLWNEWNECHVVDRRGASFGWMQQWRTQWAVWPAWCALGWHVRGSS